MSSTSGSSVVAKRYASALLGVALEQDLDREAIADELKGFVELLQSNAELNRVLSTTTIAAPKRLAVLHEVLSRANFTPATVNTLRLLTQNERLGLCEVVATQYRRNLDDFNKVASGAVTSAHKLSDVQRQSLSARLSEVTGKTMQLSYDEDPTILGGLVVRIGNRVYDASVSRQLTRFKENALTAI